MKKSKRQLLGNLLNELDNSLDYSLMEIEKNKREKTKEPRKLKFKGEKKLIYKKNSANLMLKKMISLIIYLKINGI